MAKNEKPGRLVLIIVSILLLLGGAGLLLTPKDGDWGVSRNAAAIAVGARLYAENCADCHGVNLEGQPDWKIPNEDGMLPPPPHDETGHTWHHGDELLFNYTKMGGAALALEGFTSGMPGFAETLTDSEIRDILAFIKSTWPEDIQQMQAARSQ